MKKIISLLLIMTMLLTLCACGEKKAIEKQLQGDWKDNKLGINILTFDNGKVSSAIGQTVKHGTYKIEDGKIVLIYENGVEGELEYTFENNELKLKSHQKVN